MGLASGWLRTDLSPLRESRDFRFLYASRTVTLLGSLAAEVAILVQARDLTGSAFAVGLLGAVELVPLVIFGLIGGSIADRRDRGQVLRWCEAGLGLCTGGLLANALLPHPAVWPLYVIAGLTSAVGGLQRPSFDAAVPRLVHRDQLTAAIALLAASSNTGEIAGSAIGGVLAAGPGPAVVYGLDTASFAVSLIFLCLLRPMPAPAVTEHAPRPGPRGLLDGVRYAARRQELVGSYLADLAAMGFAYPNALFPFLAAGLHASWSVGLMFAAPPAGALAASVVSGWAGRVHRHGVAIALAAAGWGAAITALGFAPDVTVALACLLVAGAADMISGIFRQTLWTQTIPDQLRGRMAGVEMLSYSVGPTAGQLRAGAVAAATSTRVSLWSGGLACVGTVGLVCLALPGFRAYSARHPAAVADAAGPGPEAEAEHRPSREAG
jgi:MFS family permease